MTRDCTLVVAVIVAILLSSCTEGVEQVEGSSISGVVKDPASAGVAGAPVMDLRFNELCDASAADMFVTESDKADILGLVLQDAVKPETLSALGALFDGNRRMILSTANMDASWVPSMLRMKVALLNPTEIQKKADRDGQVWYLSASALRIRGSCVGVAIVTDRAVAGNGRRRAVRSGSNYEFHRESGKWVGTIASEWIVN